MTHLLPGGGVPRVHGAQSPVPPRLSHLATPRSVRHLATVVAGAYPLRRPPDACSPVLPVPLGPCYLLVASETPMGPRGGCLAAELVRSTVCYNCLGGCSALVVCARRSRQVFGGGGRCRFSLLSWGSSLPSRPSLCVLRSLPPGCPFHGRQRPAVRRPVRPESRGVLGELPADRGPGHHPAVRAVPFGPVCVAASPLLHRGGRVERGPLQQCLSALPLREGGWGRLWEALCAQTLQVRVIWVLPALLRGRPREDEELVQVPVALHGGRVLESQPLSHHASCVGGLDAVL